MIVVGFGNTILGGSNLFDDVKVVLEQYFYSASVGDLVFAKTKMSCVNNVPITLSKYVSLRYYAGSNGLSPL